MAYEQNLKNLTVLAGSDLSTHQYKFVAINSSGKMALASAGGHADGVLQDKPSADGTAGVMAYDGVSKVKVGVGGLTAGDPVAAGANGTAVLATSGDEILGTALKTAAANDISPVLLSVRNESVIA